MHAMKTPSSCQTSRRQVLGLSLAALAATAVPGAARAGYMVRAWPDGKAAPALGLTDLDGKTWNHAALKGQPVMLNFWASWCEPCRAEMPTLQQLAVEHQARGLQVMAVNFREAKTRQVIRAWREKYDKDNGLLCFSSDWTNPVLWSHYGLATLQCNQISCR